MSERPFYQHQSRRSVVHSTRGIVSSSQPLASQAGIHILEQGGNAADAAVAVIATLNLTEPCSTGIGGDMFMLYFDAATKTVRSLNGSGRSPAASSLAQLRADLGVPESAVDASIPTTSVHAVTVPGAAAGWVDCVEKFGSGKLGMERILAPAVRLAEEGFPVSETSAYYWARSEARIKQASPNGFEMLKPDAAAGYRAPREGELMRNPTLAQTFRRLAQHGKKGFYEGPVAEAVVAATSAQGGRLSLEDLAAHGARGSEETEPLKVRFAAMGANAERGGLDVWEHPPNGQGIVALMALGILQALFDGGKIDKWTPADHNGVEHLHACIEALRIAFADGNWFVSDPVASKVPSAELISPDYLATRAALFSRERALPTDLAHGSPAHRSSDTVYFCVTDAAGNAASFINSNYAGFGTAIVPAGCGFTLQNRGAGFSLRAGHPNAYAPGKRPYHTIIPGMITHADDGSLAAAFGVMGGFMQPQGHVQVLLNAWVFGLDVQAALDAPRLCLGEGMPGPDGGGLGGETVYLEEGISPSVVDGLRARGHVVKLVGGQARAMFGRGQIIRAIVEDGVTIFSAGSDPRADGAAIPMI